MIEAVSRFSIRDRKSPSYAAHGAAEIYCMKWPEISAIKDLGILEKHDSNILTTYKKIKRPVCEIRS